MSADRQKDAHMQIFFHPEQLKHRPQSYYSRGKMRQPQEKPERMHELLRASQEMGLPVSIAKEFGTAPILGVHTPGYISFLKMRIPNGKHYLKIGAMKCFLIFLSETTIVKSGF